LHVQAILLIFFGILFFKDDRNPKDYHHVSTSDALQFRRRNSTLSSADHTSSSIILRPSIFRKNFRPSAVQVRDYTRTSSKNNFS